MARAARIVCGKCGAIARRADVKVSHYALHLAEGAWVERFTYPAQTSRRDDAWEKSEGIRVAQCCKAIVGGKPFLWPYTEDSPASVLAMMKVPGRVEWICPACAAKIQGEEKRC